MAQGVVSSCIQFETVIVVDWPWITMLRGWPIPLGSAAYSTISSFTLVCLVRVTKLYMAKYILLKRSFEPDNLFCRNFNLTCQ